MKKKLTGRPVRQPARESFRSSLGEGGFSNACLLIGLFVFFAGILFALLAASPTGRTVHGEAKPRALTHPVSGAISGDGANCYTITSGTDTIVPGTTDTGNHCVWCETPITLPFPFVLYDQTFNAVNVSSSGRLDFVCANDPANLLETCLPAPPNNCPFDYTIFPLWYEWGTLTSPGCSAWANGCGIFTSISGTAPNRIFNIEWHVVNRYNDVETADFEVRLYENDPNKRFDVIYGSITQGLNTGFDVAGVQGPTGFFTQNFCRTFPPQNVSRTYAIMTPCPTPTATATPTPTPTPAGNIIVTNTNDSGPGSLRQVLADANDGDTIGFAVSGTIGLTSGELVIDNSVTIIGPGSNLLTVRPSQGSFFRVFNVMPSHSITIQGLTISFGYAGSAQGGGIYLDEHVTATIADCSLTNNYTGDIGGAIFIEGYGGGAMLTVLNSTISNNTAGTSAHGGMGAGIYNNGATLTIIDSSVSNNTAWSDSSYFGGHGGGIVSGGEGTLEISNTTISSNQAGIDGGGLSIFSATATITNSTISGNVAGFTQPGEIGAGGGISNFGTLTITNCTISGNYAHGSTFKGGGEGGGIYGGAQILNSTLSGNSADVHGGSIDGGTFDIGNSVLNGGSPENINNATVTSQGYNVCSDNGGGFLNGPGDQINTDPTLGPLQDNGGPTFTHELLTGSPAIDAGDPSFTPPPYYDQRGPDFWRVRNGRIDVGSFEVQSGSTPSPTPTPTMSPTPTPTATAAATATATFTPTPTSTATATPSATATPTATATATATPAPTVTTNAATNVASSSATLNGSVNPRGSTTTVYFQWGTTTSYGHTTSAQTKTGNTSLPITANISGLSASHLYHFRIVATNSGGTSFGTDKTFTTLSATGPPVVTTNPATNLTTSSARLNGSLDPHGLTTTVYFKWGTTISYGHTTSAQTQTGNTYRNIIANISGLTTHHTYHFRIVATNSAGTRMGSDSTFNTP